MREFCWTIEYLATFIEVFLCCFFCGTFIVKDKLKGMTKYIFGISVVVSLLVFISNQFSLFSSLTSVMFVVLCILMQCVLYKRNYVPVIALVLTYSVILSAVDFFVVYFMALNLDQSMEYITGEQSLIRCSCIILSKCILGLLMITLNKLVVHNITVPVRYILVTALCSGFLLISNFVMINSEINRKHDEISGFSMVFFIATLGIEMIIFFYLIKIAEGYEQKEIASLIELKNKMLQKSFLETEQAFDLWRKSIHDYKQNIIILSQMAEEGKLEEIKEYLQNENEMISKELFGIKTGNSVVDALVNTKRRIAEGMGIVFVVNAAVPGKLTMSEMELSTLLGNLIDNAIEAEQKEENPYIEVNIKQEKSFLIIGIKNKCTSLPEKNKKTTKSQPEFHGIGLKSVQNTVKKYDGEMVFGIKKNEFVVSILIQNKLV